MTRTPTCHPGARYGAHGLCHTCYMRGWRSGEYAASGPRVCKLCPRSFVPSIAYQEHCSDECRRRARSLARHDGAPDVETAVLRDPLVAGALAAAYVARGCRRVSRRAAAAKLRDVDGWVKAWKSGELYIVRAVLPESYRREEAA